MFVNLPKQCSHILASAVARLFTPKIAAFYEEFYQSKGVKFVKGTVLTSFDFNSDGKVLIVLLFACKKILSQSEFC